MAGFFRTCLRSCGVVRRLKMEKKQGIEQLFASGMPKRKIARTLGIDRKSVDRHLRALKSKGATPEEALTTEVLTGSESSKGPMRSPGRNPWKTFLGHSQTSRASGFNAK